MLTRSPGALSLAGQRRVGGLISSLGARCHLAKANLPPKRPHVYISSAPPPASCDSAAQLCGWWLSEGARLQD